MDNHARTNNNDVNKRASHHNNILALRLVSVAVASCFSSAAFAAGTGGQFAHGTGSITTSGNLQTIINSPNAIINWNSFSSSPNETIRFLQQSASSAVLNRVIGLDPTVLLGTLTSNGRVFIINPNGILFGAGSVVDVNGLVASTLDISDDDFIHNKLNFNGGSSAASVVNQGFIRTATGGGVYLIAPDVTNSGIIKSPEGQVVLAAGHSVQLIDAGTPELQVQINAGGNAVNVGSIIAHSGDIGIYGALITQGGKLDADSATVGKGGTITLHASQDIDMQAGGVTTASGGTGNNDAGSISIIADGSLNVAQGHAIHVDGGKQGGDAGSLEVSGKHHISLNGDMTGVAVSGYRGGSINVDPSNISITTVGAPPTFTNPGPFITDGAGVGTLLINPTALKTWADAAGWFTVTLTADQDLTVASDIGTATAVGRFNHNLTLNAGDDVLINANVFLGTTKTLNVHAVDNLSIKPASTAGVTVDVGDLILSADNDISIGAVTALGKTNLKAAGSIHAVTGTGASDNLIIRAGNIPMASNGQNLDTTVTITAGKDIELGAGGIEEIWAGNVLASASGLGVHTATATANVNINAGGDFNAHAQLVWARTGIATALASVNNLSGVATNTVKADASVSITAGKGIAVSATGPNANIYLSNNTAHASAYTKGNGADTPSGSETATANSNLTLTAGTGITLSEFDTAAGGAGAILLYAGRARALAGTSAAGNGNTLGGNNTATATTNLSLKTTAGNISIADGGVDGANLSIYHLRDLASAYQTVSGLTNTVSGNNTATVTNNISLTAPGDISISALNVRVLSSVSTSISAIARQQANGGIAGNIEKLSGVQKATTTAQANLTAGAAINITARTGDVSIGDPDRAKALADQLTSGGAVGATISTTGNVANAMRSITLKAGSDINVTAKNNVRVKGGSAYGSAYQQFNNTDLSTLSGNQSASATNNISFTAGTGNLNMSATNAGLLVSGQSAHASAYQRDNGGNSSNTFTGNHSAAATAGITFTAGKELAMAAPNSNLQIRNDEASAQAFQRVTGTNKDKLTGTHSATATNGITLTAGGSLNLTAWKDGDLIISGSGTNAAYAYDAISGGGNNKFSGNNTATATNGITLKAGTLGYVNLTGGDVAVSAGRVLASASDRINGASSNAPPAATSTNNNTANTKNGVSITAGKDIAIKATDTSTVNSGDLRLTLDSNARALAGNRVGSNKNTTRSNNTATAANTVTLLAGNSIVLNANDQLQVSGSRATASAYNYATSNSHTLTGTNTATATGAISFTATTGAISLQATGTGGSVIISAANDARAKAYDYLTGNNKNKVTGNNSATAGLSIKFTAGTDITVAAYQEANIYDNDAVGSAYNFAAGNSNNAVTGSQLATATNKIDLIAKGAISVVASNNSLYASMDGGASANAYNLMFGNINNTITGNNTANATVGISLSAANISLDGSGVNLYNAGGNSASARNSLGANSHDTITGTNKATASGILALTATGTVSLAGNSSGVTLNAGDDGAASAYNRINSGKNKKITGANTAVGTTAINLKAGTTLTVTGSDVSMEYSDASAHAFNYIGGSTGNVVTGGNNTATASNNINLTAGGAINIAASNSDISAEGNDAIAIAYNFAGGKLLSITGANTATADAGISIRGTSVTMTADSDLGFSGGGAYRGVAYNSAGGSSHTIVGNNKASANNKIDIAATAGNLSLMAHSGDIEFSNYDVRGSAYNKASGTKNKITGANTANGGNTVSLSATGAVKLSGQSGVFLHADGASAFAVNIAGGTNNMLSGNQVSIVNNTLSVKSGPGGIDINGHTGSVYVSADGPIKAYAYNFATGNTNTVTGNHTATATGLLSLTAPTLNIVGDGVYINGADDSALAYNYAGGSANNVTGASKTTATTSILLAATGAININATTNRAQIDGSNSAQGHAYNYVSGAKNKITGGNTATAGNTIGITAGTNLAITGTSASVYVHGASASASNHVFGGGVASNGNTVTGNHTAKGTATVTLKAGGDLALSATTGNLQVRGQDSASASAYNEVSGGFNKLTASNTASADNLLNISGKSVTLSANSPGGGVDISGQYGYGHAFNKNFSNNNTIIGSNKATANTAFQITATGNLVINAGAANNVDINNNGTGYAYAYNYMGGNADIITGGNTASGTSSISLTGAAISIAAGNVNTSNRRAEGHAYNFAGGMTHTITGGNNTATANDTISLKATGAVSLVATAANGHVQVSDSNGRASAYNSAVGGNLTSITGTNAATANAGISITGSTIAMQATGLNGDVIIRTSSEHGSANNNIGGGSLNKVSGNNTVTDTGTVVLKASGDITLAGGNGTTGSVLVGGFNNYARAQASNTVAGSNILNHGNTLTGNNTVAATNTISIGAGGNLALAAHNVMVDGDSGVGSAYNLQYGDFNKITGINTASGVTLVSLTAGKALTMAANAGQVNISADDSTRANADNTIFNLGLNNTTLGGNTATGTNDVIIKAGTGLSIAGNNISIFGTDARASASHHLNGGNLNALTGNNAATARSSISLTAGTLGIALNAANGNVTVAGVSSAYASASHYAGSLFTVATNNTLSGTDTATATNSITLSTTGNLAMKATSNVVVSADNAFAQGINQAYGNTNTLSGANTATATNSILLNASGNLTVDAGNQARIYTNAAVTANALQKVFLGIGNKEGANNATGNVTVTLKAGKNVSIAGDASFSSAVYIATGLGGNALASDAVGANAIAAIGADVASANNNLSITAGGTLNVAAGDGYVYIYNAPNGAYHAAAKGQGKNTAGFNDKVTLAATGALSVSGHYVGVVGAHSHGSALASGAATTAVNNAIVNGDINISGSSVALSDDAFGVSIYGYSGGDGVRAKAIGSGKNAAIATADTNIIATGALDIFANGTITIAGVEDSAFTEQAWAVANNVGDVATATAHTDITLKGSSVTMATPSNLRIGKKNALGSTFALAAGAGTRSATMSNSIKVQAGVLNLNAGNVTIEGGNVATSGAGAKVEANTLVYTNTGTITTTAVGGDLNVNAGLLGFGGGGVAQAAAGIAATTGLTLAIADDVFIMGGSTDFQVVNGAYTRNITDSGWRYGTAATPLVALPGTGIVTPGLPDGSYTTFGLAPVIGKYTLGNSGPFAAFIQIK